MQKGPFWFLSDRYAWIGLIVALVLMVATHRLLEQVASSLRPFGGANVAQVLFWSTDPDADAKEQVAKLESAGALETAAQAFLVDYAFLIALFLSLGLGCEVLSIFKLRLRTVARRANIFLNASLKELS